MEDSKSNKHPPRLFEQGLNDKRVELFDELIHPEYNSHNAYVEPGRRALSILSAPPRTKIHTGGGDNAKPLNFACTSCAPKRRSISIWRRFIPVISTAFRCSGLWPT